MSLEHDTCAALALDDFVAAAEFLKALGHPLRLRIGALLAAGEANVTTLAEGLGVPQAIASQQLRILRMSNVVSARRANGQAIYSLIDPRVVKLLHCMGARTP